MKLALVSLAAILAAPIAVAQGNLEISGAYSHVDTDIAELGALTGRGTSADGVAAQRLGRPPPPPMPIPPPVEVPAVAATDCPSTATVYSWPLLMPSPE